MNSFAPYLAILLELGLPALLLVILWRVWPREAPSDSAQTAETETLDHPDP